MSALQDIPSVCMSHAIFLCSASSSPYFVFCIVVVPLRILA